MIVLDASAAVDLLTDPSSRDRILAHIGENPIAAPSHLDAEVLSAVGQMVRGGQLADARVAGVLTALANASVSRYELPGLLAGAWERRGSIRLADALYVELAAQLGTVVVTTDARLARATPLAQLPPTLES